MNAILVYLKAHVATVSAVGAWLTASLADGAITGQEWWGLVVALGGGGAVAAVKNKKRKPAKKTARKDAGLADGAIAVAVVVIVLALLLGFAVNHLWFILLALLIVVALF